MTLQDTQLHLERESINRGMERLREQLQLDTSKGRAADNPVVQAQIKRLLERTVDGVHALQLQAKKSVREGMTTGRRLSGWEVPVCMMDVDTMAFITLHTLCNRTLSEGYTGVVMDTVLSKTIGELCNLQLRYNQLRAEERGRVKEGATDPGYNRLYMMHREVKRINPRSLKKWLKKMDDISTEVWDVRARHAVGYQLIEAVMEACPDIFTRKMSVVANASKGTRSFVTIEFTDHAKATLEKRLLGMGMNMPWLLPMVCEPLSWTPEKNGGYLTIMRDFVKPTYGQHYEGDIPPTVYDAINSIQSTRWSINKRVLEIAKKAVEDGVCEVLPVRPVEALPPMATPEAWETMPNDQKAVMKLQRRLVHENNAKLENRRRVISRQLEVAKKFSDRDVIYFPHCVDFRGRAYPLPQDLHPQGDDFGKAMLHFADAKPIDASGFKWLQYQVASCYGMDKLGRDDQLNWVGSHANYIEALAADPFDPEILVWWSGAEEPWQFLAAALELAAAMEQGEGYMSHLPVSVDGSCNGLQHLSAMGLDPVGAQAVNLCPGPRQDIYGMVAHKVSEQVPSTSPWCGNVTRKVVKRGVMTKPYGLTRIGMKSQLVSDRSKTWSHVQGDIQDNASMMRDWMAVAISSTVLASVEIMDWMQKCAGLLADEGRGIRWTSPSSFTVNQFYSKTVIKRYTIVGVTFSTRAQRTLTETAPGIRKSKQVLAVSPNIVHSFDAAHMTLSIKAAVDEGLTESFAAVHDSFGVHASDMDRFLNIIKEQFVSIYSQPVLHNLQVEFQRQAPEGVTIPEPPALGDFDIEQVGQSEFFFA